MAQNKEDLEFMAVRLVKEYEEWGLMVNQTKTKCLCIKRESGNVHANENETVGACDKLTVQGEQNRTENLKR